MTAAHVPAGAHRPLLDEFDALLVDLDGVVQLDDVPVAGAAEVLAAARSAGVRLVFLTNNAAREPSEVAARLARLGVTATTDEVMTSAMAAARLLADRLASGSAVLVVGGSGLTAAVADAGLRPVRDAAEAPAAVVQGWAPGVGWAMLAEAAVAVRSGALWVATNLDRTLPSPRGPLPGNGALVGAVRTAVGREPDAVAGKPSRPLFDAAVGLAGGSRPLVVGDRLDTDIAGALAIGLPALLVLSGVARPADVLAAPPGQRPTYLGADLRALTRAHPPVAVDDSTARCGATTVRADGSVEGPRALPTGDDGLDGLRAACALAWAGSLAPDRYAGCLRALGLD